MEIPGDGESWGHIPVFIPECVGERKETYPRQRSVVVLPDFQSLLPNRGIPPGATETLTEWGGTSQRQRILFLSFVFILNENSYTPLRLTASGEWGSVRTLS